MMRHLLKLTLCLALLWPSWALAAPPSITSTYDGAGTSGATASIASVACSGSNTLLLVFAGSNNEGDPTGITKGATSLTLLENHSTGGIAFNSIWYLKGASNTSETVTATWGSSPANGAAASAICLSGVDQTTTFGTPAEGSGGGTAVSGQSVSGSAADDLIIDSVSFSSGGGTTISAGAGGTKRTEQNPLGGWTIVSGSKASGSSQSPTWTISSSQDWTQIVVNVLGSGGGGGPTCRGSLLLMGAGGC